MKTKINYKVIPIAAKGIPFDLLGKVIQGIVPQIIKSFDIRQHCPAQPATAILQYTANKVVYVYIQNKKHQPNKAAPHFDYGDEVQLDTRLESAMYIKERLGLKPEEMKGLILFYDTKL